MRTRNTLYLEIFLVSFAALLLEIGYTRVFSYKLSSYFTYLIIGFAMLGLGAGGVFVAVSRPLREAAPARLLSGLATLGGLAIGGGYFAIAWIEVSTHRPPTSPGELMRLAAICLALFAGLLVIGVMIARIFTLRIDQFQRLYFADLAGAALGCAAAVPLMIAITPPGCIFAAGAAVAASGLRLAAGSRWLRAMSAGTALLLAVGVAGHRALPDPVVDPVKTMGRKLAAEWFLTPVLQRWHPVFRVDVVESAVAGTHQKWLIHDGQLGSVLWRYDGRRKTAERYFRDLDRAIPFSVARDRPRVLIIGAAGGIEILASLHFGAQSITAVELNPVTVSLLRERFADFTGRLAENEKVTLVNAEGRFFLHRDEERYDLVYFVAPDSYASMNAAQASGFVLVEGYLYTKEAIQEVFRHLAPGGVLCMQFGEVNYHNSPNRTSRYLSTARQALLELGIDDFASRVLLVTNVSFPIHSSTILLSNEVFSKQQIEAVAGLAEKRPDMVLRHPARHADDHRAVPNAVINAGPQLLEQVYDRYPFDIRPVSDDAPFFWHFARWRSFFFGATNVPVRHPADPTQGVGEVSLLVMLAICVVFATVFLLLPFALIRRRWAALPAKPLTAVYFAALGLGFMGFEIAMIQKLTLFLGYPTYTLTVTLFGLLLFSGIGSFLTERYAERWPRAPLVLAGMLAGLGVFVSLGLDRILDPLFGVPFPLRVLLAMSILAPLGLCLGGFMPIGLAAVAGAAGPEHRQEYAAWAWAVNGFFSVIGSMWVTILAMTHGFRTILLLATGLYLLAAVTSRAILAASDSSA